MGMGIKKQIVYKNIEEIKPYKNNPRKNDEAVKFVANSIKKFNFQNPIIIDKNNVIVAGHTRYKACKQLGINEVPCIIADDLSEEQIKAFRLADNKVGEIAEWDFDMLDLELDDIELDMTDFGFDIEDNNIDIDINSTVEKRKLSDRFLIPPFDIFDGRKGDWLERKRIWKNLIGDNGQARKNVKVYNSSCFKLEKYNKKSYLSLSDISILDPVLAEIINYWFIPNKNSNVCDCFAGDTVFGFVSEYLGNKFTGIELREEQADFNNNHTGNNATYICDDGINILKHIQENSQDLLFSCPPYYDLEQYSSKENDASNQETYEDFIQLVDDIFSNAVKTLKNNRFAVIVVGDIRNKKNGAYYNFPNDIINIFLKNNFILYNNIKLLTPIGTAPFKANRYMRNRKMVHIYQDVLVFYKGDTKEIKNIFKDIEVLEIEGEDV